MKVLNCHSASRRRFSFPGSERSTASKAGPLLILLLLLAPCAPLGDGAPAKGLVPAQNPPVPASSSSNAPAQSETKPLHERQLVGLVKGGVNSSRIALLVDKRGIDFTPTVPFLRELIDAGADDVLIQAVIKAKETVITPPTLPVNPAPSPQAAPTLPASGPAPASAGATAAAGSVSHDSQQTLQQALGRAADLEQRHQWAEADGAYREAVNLGAKNAAAHLGLARVLSQEQRWDEAAGEFRQALQLDSGNAQAHSGLAAALAAKHDLAGSIAEYREAVRLNGNDAELQSKVGDALYANGELDAAIDAYRAALALKPNDAQVANRLGVALYAAGDMKGAVAAYRQAVQLSPNDAQAHNNLGDALLNSGDRRGALEEYHRAFEIAPNGSTLGTSYAALAKQLSSPQPAAAATNK